MSLNLLKLDIQKPWLNARVQDLTVDGVFNGPTSIPLSSLQSSGLPAQFIHDDGVAVGKKNIELPDLQSIGGGAPDGTYLRHNLGTISFEPAPTDDSIYSNDGTLTGPRTVDCNGNNLSFTNAGDFNIQGTNVNLVNTPTGTTTEPKLIVRDPISGVLLQRDVSTISNTNFDRHISLAQSGGDYTTLTDAVNAAISLVPSAVNPVEIQVYPGTYTFANPLTIPSYVLLTSLADGANSIVIFSGLTAGNTGLVLSNECSVDGITLTNVDFGMTMSAGIVRISNIVFLNCFNGMDISGGNCVAKSCTINNVTGLTILGFRCQTGGQLFGTDLYVRNGGGTIIVGYQCLVGSIMFLDSCHSIDCVIGSSANGGIINYSGGRTLNATSLAHSSNTGGTLRLLGHEILGTGNHLDIGVGSFCNVQACNADETKINNLGTLTGYYQSASGLGTYFKNDIIGSGNVGGNTLSGTLTESDISPGTNGQVLKTVLGVSTWDTDLSGINIYDSDGSLTGNRIVTGASNNLSFTGIGDLNFGASSIFLNTVPTLTTSEPRLLVRDNVTGIVLERDVSSLPSSTPEVRTSNVTQNFNAVLGRVDFGSTLFTSNPNVTYTAGTESYALLTGHKYMVTLRFTVDTAIVATTALDLFVNNILGGTVGGVKIDRTVSGAIYQTIEQSFPIDGGIEIDIDFDPRDGSYNLSNKMIKIEMLN